MTGLERILASEVDVLEGKRIGLIANATTVVQTLQHGIDLLYQKQGIELKVIFGPEHGLRGTAQDLEEVDDGPDSVTGLPVKSLYGKTLIPNREMLEGLDALVFDVQDVGSRYYTYVWTMSYAMEACARDNLEFVVLDRPNPINGVHVEGNLIEEGYLSFVGLYPIPNRHGMTSGELAKFVNAEFDIGCDLTVVEIRGWPRNQWFDETGLPWVMPSPNMPTLSTATVYPGACLIEGTNLSEGRGTTRPFEIMGAPWLDAEQLVRDLQEKNLPGVLFRPLSFVPTFQKFSGELCRGVQQHIIDREIYRPLLTGYAILQAAYRQDNDKFEWRPPPYEYEYERLAFDILAGNNRVRQQIEADTSLHEIEASYQEDLANFKVVREQHLMYK